MNNEMLSMEPKEAKTAFIEEPYVDPEILDIETLEVALKEGEINNVRPIENHHQKVSPHADRVLLGDLLPHAEQLFEAEITIPGQEKKLLVVYKPENGGNIGTDVGRLPSIPKESSPHDQKEVAAWIVAKTLGLGHITEPVVIRTLNEGPGSVRPYIWGEPLEILTEVEVDKALSNQEELEDFALYDYILQTLDRRMANMIWEEIDGQGKLKAIDHSLTFFDEEFASRYTIKGPRLQVAYDNSNDPPTLKQTPLPNRLLVKINEFISREPEIRHELASSLTSKEINGIFDRAQKTLKHKTFL